jgi:hypothetical protein
MRTFPTLFLSSEINSQSYLVKFNMKLNQSHSYSIKNFSEEEKPIYFQMELEIARGSERNHTKQLLCCLSGKE